MIVLNFPSLLTSQNVQAAFRVIRVGESWNDRKDPERDELAFRVRYGGYRDGKFLPPKYFAGWDDHPRVFEPTKDGRKSSAAGFAQITATTWDDIRSRYANVGPMFTPVQQMHCVVAIMHDEGALDDVIDGRFDAWIAKCGRRWTSLPNAVLMDGGSKTSYALARQTYIDYGGTFWAESHDEVTPAPIEDRSQPARPEDVDRITKEDAPMVPPLLVGLLMSLAEIFSPLVRAKLTRALDKTTDDPVLAGQLTDKLIGFAQTAAAQAFPGMVPPPPAPGAPAPAAPPAAAPLDPVVAVGVVKARADLAAQVEQQASDYLDQLAPMLDRVERLQAQEWEASETSMDRAAARASLNANPDEDKLLTVSLVAMVGGMLILLAVGIVVLIALGKPYAELLTLFAAGVGMVTNKFGTRIDYRYGSSRSSAAKDVVIEELSTQRRNRNA